MYPAGTMLVHNLERAALHLAQIAVQPVLVDLPYECWQRRRLRYHLSAERDSPRYLLEQSVHHVLVDGNALLLRHQWNGRLLLALASWHGATSSRFI